MGDYTVLTFTGLSKWATLNSLWAIIEKMGKEPRNVVLVHTSPISNEAKSARKMIETLLSQSDKKHFIHDISVPPENFHELPQRLKEYVDRSQRFDEKVVLDVTPGRKLFVATLLDSPLCDAVDTVSYLFLDRLEGAGCPYPMIPFKRQTLITLRGELDA